MTVPRRSKDGGFFTFHVHYSLFPPSAKNSVAKYAAPLIFPTAWK